MAFALPTRPAAAATGCVAIPGTPYMSNPKVEDVTGSSITACDREMLLVRAEAELYVWSGRAQDWLKVSYSDRSMANANYITAEAVSSCKGLATVSYRTRGHATGIWEFMYSVEDGWNWGTYYRTFECTGPLKEITP
jgi:hypothetical protein